MQDKLMKKSSKKEEYKICQVRHDRSRKPYIFSGSSESPAFLFYNRSINFLC